MSISGDDMATTTMMVSNVTVISNTAGGGEWLVFVSVNRPGVLWGMGCAAWCQHGLVQVRLERMHVRRAVFGGGGLSTFIAGVYTTSTVMTLSNITANNNTATRSA
jgi:hypothetical protein